MCWPLAPAAEDSSAIGINGDQFDNTVKCGRCRVPLTSVEWRSVWSQQAYIKASNTEEQEISSDLRSA